MRHTTTQVLRRLERELNSYSESARWAAAARLSEFVETHPEELWPVVRESGYSANPDVRMAVATCILEHLLEHHFALIFPRVRELALSNVNFGDTFSSCWKFGQAELGENEAQFDALRRQIREEAT